MNPNFCHKGVNKMDEKTLKVNWSKRENDWMIHYPTKATGHMTSGMLDGLYSFPEFLKELTERGYDLTTLKLSVKKKPNPITE